MPRYNVEHNGKWACYTTIADGFFTPFMDESEYEKWRLKEYGRAGYKPVRECNIYTMADAISAASLYHSKEEVIEDLLEAGLSKDEAEALWETHKRDPEPEEEEEG